MAEPTTSGAAVGFAAFKFIGIPLTAASLGAAIAFMLMPPQKPEEWFPRLFITFLCSLFVGPILFFLFASTGTGAAIIATAVHELSGVHIGPLIVDSSYVKLTIAAPFFMFGGLPGWYMLGWIMRWMDKRKDKDAGEILTEVGNAYKRWRP